MDKPSSSQTLPEPHSGNEPPRAHSTAELRQSKVSRTAFRALVRRPVTLVLDGVRQGYNIGAVFRLCDAMLIEKLIICGRSPDTGRRKLAQAAAGTQHWVPHEWQPDAPTVLQTLRSSGYQIAAVEQTDAAVAPQQFRPRFPLCLVLGQERHGISEVALALSDCAVAIPMLGMANSLNVATAAAIVLHHVTLAWEGH